MVQVGSAQNHIDEKQMGIEVLLYALLHLALQEALHEGCIYLEKQLLFLNPHRHPHRHRASRGPECSGH